MGSYKDSDAYRRSIRLRPDGTPLYPLKFELNPASIAQQYAERALMRRVRAAGEVL
jgi:hypothetical protein